MKQTKQKSCSRMWYVWGAMFGMGVLATLLAVLLEPPLVVRSWLIRAGVSHSEARSDAEGLFQVVQERLAEVQTGGGAPERISGPRSSGGLDLKRADLEGSHYVLADVVIASPDGRCRVVAVPRNGHYPVLHCTFTSPDDYEITEAQPAGYQGE